METVVVVPRGGDCPHRARAWQWIRPHYPLPVVEGFCEGPWSKAVAVADALTRTDADLLVVADADCYTDGVAEAVAAVRDGARWAVPHKRVHRLSQGASEKAYGGAELNNRLATARTHTGLVGGGFVVLPRVLYEQVPLDPRFVNWGGEDDSWGHALTTLAGPPTRLVHHCWHFWHPSQRRGNNDVLARRYRRAREDPAAMRTLIGEIDGSAVAR